MYKTSDASAEELTAQGYRRVSGRFQLVSRIDRADWLDFLYRHHKNWRPSCRLSRTGRPFFNVGLSRASMADYYRRVYSKDVLRAAAVRDVPSSSGDPTGYIP